MTKELKVFLRDWRKFRRLTQEELSNRIAELTWSDPDEKKLSNTQISRIERAASDITGRNLVILAQALDIEDPRELLFPPPDSAESHMIAMVRLLDTKQQRQVARVVKAMLEEDAA